VQDRNENIDQVMLCLKKFSERMEMASDMHEQADDFYKLTES
jgi:ribosomal protein S21